MRSTFWLKRVALAGGAALVLGAAAIGAVAAQQSPTPQPPATQQAGPRAERQERFLAAVAGKLGITPDRLRQAVTDARKELGLPDRPPFPRAPRLRAIAQGALTVAAQAIGITPEQLRQELPGKSLADVARSHNVDPATVATALKTAASSRLDRAVQSGRLGTDRAEQLKQRLDERIDKLMDRQLPARRPGV